MSDITKASPSGGIQLYERGQFALARQDPSVLREAFAANVGNSPSGVSAFDLIRINVPAGGGLAWNVPDLQGEPVAVAEIECVILFQGHRRAYWQLAFGDSGGGSPPDCSSLDGVKGIGFLPGDDKDKPPVVRECKTCPMAQWGSADKDLPAGKPKTNAQECSQRVYLFAVRKDDMLPIVIDLAPTSVGEMRQFMLRLVGRGIPCYGAVVGLKLKADRSNGGIMYSVVSPRLIARLDEAETTALKATAAELRPYFDKVGIETQEPQV